MKNKKQTEGLTFHDGILADCVNRALEEIERRKVFLSNMNEDVKNLEKLLFNLASHDNCVIVEDDDGNRYGIEWSLEKKRIIVTYCETVKPLVEWKIGIREFAFHRLTHLLNEIWKIEE